MGDVVVTRNFRRLLSHADIGGRVASRQVRALIEAKVLAGRLIPELATMDCPPIVMGTALAIVVGAVAAQVRVEAREDFYERFLSAARACEGVTGGRAREMQKH